MLGPVSPSLGVESAGRRAVVVVRPGVDGRATSRGARLRGPVGAKPVMLPSNHGDFLGGVYGRRLAAVCVI
jgi:hypothetical protein